MVAVRDTGPGISPDRMVNLFETFGKHDGETSRSTGTTQDSDFRSAKGFAA